MELKRDYLVISHEEILNGFKDYCSWWNDELTAIEENATLKVDKNDDIEALMPDGTRYWILTTISLKKFNEAGWYEVIIHYHIKKDSKYSNLSIFEFAR